MEAKNIATSYKLAEGIDHLPRSEKQLLQQTIMLLDYPNKK